MARQICTILVAVAPAAAFAIYFALGNPDRNITDEGLEIAARQPARGGDAASLADTIASLEQRLAKNPDNADEWVMLGESYAGLDRFGDAAKAYAKAVALEPNESHLHAMKGEAVAMAAGGVVTEEAQAAFDRALSLDAEEPRARFYLAIADYQQGRPEEALEKLSALERSAPPNAGWLPLVRSQIDLISEELGRPAPGAAAQDPAALEEQVAGGDAPYETWIALIDAYGAAGDKEKAKDAASRAKESFVGAPFVLQEIAKAETRIETGAPRGPSQEQMDAAASMTPQQREQMIEGMVAGLAARLEEQPDDLEGWTMLARSYGVLGETEKSADAFARAIDLAPEDTGLRISRARALIDGLTVEGKPLDAEAREAVDAIAALEPGHPFALYFQGLAASQQGEPDRAREYWTQLLEAMPKGGPEAEQLQQMIDAL